jgi:alpha-galactosidase
MKSPYLRALLLLSFLNLNALASERGKHEFGECYARWEAGKITIGNGSFERSWVATEAGLQPLSFQAKNPEFQWLVPTPATPSASLDVTAVTSRRTAVAAEGVCIDVSIEGKSASQKQVLWLYPGLAGAIAEYPDAAKNTKTTKPSGAGKKREASGIETEPTKRAPALKAEAGSEILRLLPRHLRIIETTLRDQSDHKNELVDQKEWLLWVNESPFDLRGCVIAAEHTLDGSGIAFLQFSPLPHARPDTNAVDFRIRPNMRAITALSHGYPVAAIAYHGGAAGRTRALHAAQRALRPYQSGRDGQLISNTWGDRNRDSRVNEPFLLKEVAAGADLGVDIIQIDDGWQKGRSSNSADNSSKGVWNGYWAADPAFWTPDPVRFPRGLEPVVQAAQAKGMKFGLWFGPDSSNDAANWKKDADHLLGLHQKLGIASFKIDSMKTLNAVSLERQRAMFDRILEGSKGTVSFDLDITAEIRPGYFGLPDIGPVYLENRYTDWGSYWPHLTLRNLWQLSQVVDPLRLRMELLNPMRNQAKYGDDLLAPARYRADTLFAITMIASPLAFCEVSNLPPEVTAQMKPLIATWKKERAEMHGGAIVPIGSAPDGVAWTGFASTSAAATYVLVFRERNASATYELPLEKTGDITILGGRGTAVRSPNGITVTIPEPLDFLWLKMP